MSTAEERQQLIADYVAGNMHPTRFAIMLDGDPDLLTDLQAFSAANPVATMDTETAVKQLFDTSAQE